MNIKQLYVLFHLVLANLRLVKLDLVTHLIVIITPYLSEVDPKTKIPVKVIYFGR